MRIIKTITRGYEFNELLEEAKNRAINHEKNEIENIVKGLFPFDLYNTS